MKEGQSTDITASPHFHAKGVRKCAKFMCKT